MTPRAKPYLGSLGITYDGVPPVWMPAQGVTRLKYEEGQHNFENVDDARIWMQIRRLYYTYNNSGIAVGWRQKGSTLQVEVWQLYIDGKQPQQLAGADDASITISALEVVPQKMTPRLVSGRGKADNTGPEKQNWFQRTFGGLFDDEKNSDKAAAAAQNERAARIQRAQGNDRQRRYEKRQKPEVKQISFRRARYETAPGDRTGASRRRYAWHAATQLLWETSD